MVIGLAIEPSAPGEEAPSPRAGPLSGSDPMMPPGLEAEAGDDSNGLGVLRVPSGRAVVARMP